MCLFTEEKRKVATEDIVVYKILRYNKLTGKCYAPYVGRRGKVYLYKKGLNVARGKESIKLDFMSCTTWTIDKGFLHAFTRKAKALPDIELLTESTTYPSRDKYIVTKMIIPKGTEYYNGEGDEICAKQLFWEEEEYNKTKINK